MKKICISVGIVLIILIIAGIIMLLVRQKSFSKFLLNNLRNPAFYNIVITGI